MSALRSPFARPGRPEVLSIDIVPDSERHGTVRDQFTLWFAAVISILGFVLGAIAMEIAGNFFWAVLAFALGTVLGLLLVGFHAIQGPRLGVPQMLQSRAQFGYYGALIIVAFTIVLDFGYLAAQLVVQGQSMNVLVPGISVPVWIVIAAVPVGFLALYGYDWIHRWQRWMSLILGVIFLVVIAQTFAHGHLPHAAGGFRFPGFALFMTVVALAATNMLSWAPYVSDYSRYLPRTASPHKAFWAVVAGNAIPTIVLAAAGAYLASVLPVAGANTPLAVKEVAGAWVLPVMAVSLIGSDVLNVYTGMLAVATIASAFRDVRGRLSTRVAGSALILAAGVVAGVLGYGSFVAKVLEFLGVLLFVFIPWTAINLTDFYLVRRGDYDVASFFTRTGRYGGWIWSGLVPYAVAVAAEVPFVDQQFYTGPAVAALGGVDVSWIVGAVVAFAGYLTAVRLAGGRAALRPGEGAPAMPVAAQEA